MFSGIAEAFIQAADIKSITIPRGARSPAGMFRVRKEITVEQAVIDLLKQVQSDNEYIETNGVRIQRPREIVITLTNLNKMRFKPDFPVSVQVMKMTVNVNVSEVELVTDGESGFPALLFTTASSLKPDVMLICALQKSVEDLNSDTPEKLRQREATRLFAESSVPVKYQAEISRCLGVAWESGVAQQHMTRCFGKSGAYVTQNDARTCAKAVVGQMTSEGQVVGVGLFFWMGLGYWMIMIFAAILRLDFELNRK